MAPTLFKSGTRMVEFEHLVGSVIALVVGLMFALLTQVRPAVTPALARE